jgi:anti-sigma-K factor RskA
MNCVELQRSLAEVEDGSSMQQRAHLSACTECTALLEELNLIVSAASELQAEAEPNPRVWNSIEIALRQEGLIRPQRRSRAGVPSFSARWGAARWLVPAAAMLLLALGIYVRNESRDNGLVQQASVAVPVANASDLDDADLMQEVSANAPAMKTQYEDNLRQVNESIHDAQSLVDQSPNDEDARRSLEDAYQQKSMLFELAMDRSQP